MPVRRSVLARAGHRGSPVRARHEDGEPDGALTCPLARPMIDFYVDLIRRDSDAAAMLGAAATDLEALALA